MRTFVQLSFLVFAALAATPAASSAQVSYARAEQLLPWSTSMRVIGDAVDPGWYPDSSRSGTATGRGRGWSSC